MTTKKFALCIFGLLAACAQSIPKDDRVVRTMTILRQSGDEYITDKYDYDSRKVLSAIESDKQPNLTFARALPADYVIKYAWEDDYPKFAGVDYADFDDYAVTIQNKKYAIVFREGLEAPAYFGALYFINKRTGAAQRVQSKVYDFKIFGDLMFYLNKDGRDGKMSIYDLETSEIQDEITGVIGFGLPAKSN